VEQGREGLQQLVDGGDGPDAQAAVSGPVPPLGDWSGALVGAAAQPASWEDMRGGRDAGERSAWAAGEGRVVYTRLMVPHGEEAGPVEEVGKAVGQGSSWLGNGVEEKKREELGLGKETLDGPGPGSWAAEAGRRWGGSGVVGSEMGESRGTSVGTEMSLQVLLPAGDTCEQACTEFAIHMYARTVSVLAIAMVIRE